MERKEAIKWLKEMLKNTYIPSKYTDPNREKKGEALKLAIDGLEVDEAYQLEYERTTESKVFLELNPFESGVIIGLLIRRMGEEPDDKPVLEPIFDRLRKECRKFEVPDAH